MLIQLETDAALGKALDEALGCLRLCRSDNLGVRYQIATLYLRLGLVQECYDFIKWWAIEYTSREKFPYTGDKYLNIKALTFVKFHVAQGLLDVKNARVLASVLPAGVETTVLGFLPYSDIGASLPNLMKLRKQVAAQAQRVFQKTHEHNSHFWAAVLDPSDLMSQPLSHYEEGQSGGTPYEVRTYLDEIFPLWLNAPGALDFKPQWRAAAETKKTSLMKAHAHIFGFRCLREAV
ncbi:hypothetical protein Poli38472_011258 [Pythium oligandrum]|uniref:Uncharacterized protein n=1 Tax=Pythium oligandrum TaxID=41045 RepID=A0A8K1CRH1_PYTOL|nr:hypothetical protein Poli38472_011258 [Pythium oligandrum]|eukprot:TMW67638.1 hypothetical protein Poli38472_011258 [Pythium oligandrum]